MRNYRVIVALVVSTVIAGGRPVFSQSPQDTALAVGGAFALLGYGPQLLTSSTLKVRVEMYQETFKLGKPLPRAATSLVPDLTYYQTVLAAGQDEMERLQESLPLIEDSFGRISPLLKNDPNISELSASLKSQASKIHMAMAIWKEFAGTVGRLSLKEKPSDADLALLMSQRAQIVSLLLDVGQARFTEGMLSSLASYLDLSVDGGKTKRIIGVYNAQSRDTSMDERLAQLLDETRRTMTPNDDGMVTEQLNLYGIKLTGAELRAATSLNDILLFVQGPDAGPLGEMAKFDARLQRIMVAIRPSSLVSFNQGPVVNEAMQEILSSGVLDEVTEKSNSEKWVPFNSAISKGRTGDHASLIYLENHATPVLKSATFNPEAFIEANAKLYQTAFASASEVFGLPLAQGDAANTGLPSINHFVIENKLAKVKAAKRERSMLALKTLTSLLQLKDEGGSDDSKEKTKAAGLLEDAAKSMAANQ